MLNADTDIQFVKGVGEKRAQLFKKLGVRTVSQLVHLYPRDYRDLNAVGYIAECTLNAYNYIRAYVARRPSENRIRKGMTIYKTELTDGADVIHLNIFNNPYLARALEEGKEYIFYGKVTNTRGSYEMVLQSVDSISEIGKLKPVYPQTAGLTSRVISSVMANALSVYAPDYDVIPEKIREEYRLCSLGYALHNVHFPQSRQDIEKARKRLMFEELLVLQLGMAKLKSRDRGYTDLIIKKDYSEEFFRKLPFTLTNAQQNAVCDAVRDMGLHEPMNRLLQGDVGSGKTAVAASVIYSAVKNGMQAALMAPTSILAAQHYNTFSKFFEGTDIKVELIVGSTTQKKKKEIKQRAESGETQLLIGTHTLIQSDVNFKSLGLVVTDEQHRFGVRQRSSLSSKGDNPHVLVMSATPIPRTLALIIYGDLDLSVLNELPPGRQKIDTYTVDESYRQRVYGYIKKHLDEGLQGYIVCPLVEESEMLGDVSSAKEYFETLKNGEFKNYSLGLLHGKMKPKEKEEIMSDFSSGKIQLLVSTTVIEVGVDVPNAVIMVIESAERFGLSQLHQLRGRVGRGSHKSSCILIATSLGETTKQRLDVMRRTNDGFVIADEDLKIRGPGDFFGERQHGLPEVRIADMLEDMVLCNQSQQAVRKILADDPNLEKHENAALNREIENLFREEYNLN